ncbi:MAG: succinate dehydrogenase assembly factor 2 [Burkholderiales bacterium]|nr:succinate dehydrogenase assembly factor 2 [Burkholderiales bacterium]
MEADVLDTRTLGKLQWRCRRGLLENDLLIGRFFERHGHQVTTAQAEALAVLMDLGDNDLMDLLLRRTELQGELDTRDIKEVLEMMRPPLPASQKSTGH